MMDTIYDKRSNKSEFAVKILLPYYIRTIRDITDLEEKETLEEEIAGLKIFPYKSADKIRLGSLRQNGTHWYYREKNSKTPIVESDNYRIIADELLDKNILQSFRELFGADGADYIGIYNNEAVMLSMIEEMSLETAYSDTWWDNAGNLYRLWDKKNPGERYEKACENIATDLILLDEDTCDRKHQQLLFKYQVFKDLRQTEGFRRYVSIVGKRDLDEGIRFLKYLGVKDSAEIYEDNGTLTTDKGILSFFQKIHKKVVFPVSVEAELQYEAAELSSYIFFHLLFESDNRSASRLAESLNGEGITVLNAKEEYVELSNDLFYVDELYAGKAEDIIEKMASDRYEELNSLLIEPQEDISSLYHLTDICDVGKYENYDFDRYHFSKLLFYKWVWNFKEIIDEKDELIDSVLLYFTGCGRADGSDAAFAIDIIKTAWEDGAYLDRYHFRIDSDTDVLFDYANAIDKILLNDEEFPIQFTPRNVHPMSVGAIKEHVINRMADMLKEDKISTSLYEEIKEADFWNHVYAGSEQIAIDEYDEDEKENKKYVLIDYRNAKKKYIKGILIPLGNEEEATKGLGQFIKDKYKITIPDLVTNWKEAYEEIVSGISSFINKRYELHSEDDLINAIPDMADVKTFGEEEKIWVKLKRMSDSLLSDKRAGVNLGRDFLIQKYSGRCQLCGNRTARKNIQDSHFYTFRMVKEHENPALFNMASNLFCVCPSCHGSLQYGSFMGQDLSEIAMKARQYIQLYNENVDEDLDDNEESVISMFADTKKGKEGFKSPIICNVTVNGKRREMAFSWEHFIWLAFILNENEVLQ